MCKIYVEPESPMRGRVVDMMTPPNKGARLRYMMHRNRQMSGGVSDVMNQNRQMRGRV